MECTCKLGGREMGEYGIDYDDETKPVQTIIYVREEPPRLLWRSIVQGFGLAVGFSSRASCSGSPW